MYKRYFVAVVCCMRLLIIIKAQNLIRFFRKVFDTKKIFVKMVKILKFIKFNNFSLILPSKTFFRTYKFINLNFRTTHFIKNKIMNFIIISEL